MAEAIITLPDGRRAKLTGPTREAIIAQAEKLAAGVSPVTGREVGIDPNTGNFDPTLATVDRVLANPSGGQNNVARKPKDLEFKTFAERLFLDNPRPQPGPSGPLDVALEFARGQRLPNNPLVLGTIGSIGFPPLRAGMARSGLGGVGGLLSRAGQRVAPPVTAAAGIGGTAAGIEESQRPGSTPASVAKAGLKTGARLGAAELAGLGLTSGAAKLVAPRLPLDPLKGFRREVGKFVKTVPERTRAAARRVEEMLPESAQSVTEAAREVSAKANRVIVELARQNTLGQTASQAAKALGSKRVTAEAVVRAIGENRARRFGFNPDKPDSAAFMFRVLSSGDSKVLKSLQKRLGKKALEDFQLQTLGTLLTRASVRGADGRLRLNGERLRELWDNLPPASKAIYSPGTRRAVESLATFGSAAARVARFAASPTGSEFAEAILSPAVFAVGGPGLGIPLLIAKQLLFPGPLTRFLTRDKLPNEIVQMIGGQAVKTPIRAGLLEGNRDE